MIFKTHNIYSIKLSTTEEIVAAVVSEDDTKLTITRPLVFTVNPQTGSPILIPWLFGIEPKSAEAIPLYKYSVVAKVKVADELADSYREVTSGISKAPASVLQGLKN